MESTDNSTITSKAEVYSKSADEEHEDAPLADLVTCNLEQLIAKLTLIKEEHGNLPILYWDQYMWVKFGAGYALNLHTSENNKYLTLGGFHCDGDKFQNFNEAAMNNPSTWTIL